MFPALGVASSFIYLVVMAPFIVVKASFVSGFHEAYVDGGQVCFPSLAGMSLTLWWGGRRGWYLLGICRLLLAGVNWLVVLFVLVQ